MVKAAPLPLAGCGAARLHIEAGGVAHNVGQRACRLQHTHWVGATRHPLTNGQCGVCPTYSCVQHTPALESNADVQHCRSSPPNISGFFGLEAHHKPLSTLSQLYSACLQVEVVLAGRGRLRLICAAPQQQRCGRLVPAQLVELLLLRTASACRCVPSDIVSMQRHADA